MKWNNKVDFLSIRYPVVLLLIYLVVLVCFDRPFVTTSYWQNEITPSIDNRTYFWLQFVVFIFSSYITSVCFEETFRHPASQYIRVLKPGVLTVFFKRYIRLLLSLEVIYLPFVCISLFKIEKSITNNEALLNKASPHINTLIPLFHCGLAMLFYVTVTLFFLMLFKRRTYVMVIFMGYCTFEATVLPYLFPELVLFRGAFSKPDFINLLPPNILIILVLTIIMFFSLVLYSYFVFSATIPKSRKRLNCRRNTV